MVHKIFFLNDTKIYLGHERSPEIIEEEVGDGRMRSQVLVVFDGRDVVEDEAALQRIPVGGSGYSAHNHRWQPQRKRRPVGHRQPK